MKKTITTAAALALALILGCSAALADATLEKDLARIADPKAPAAYTLSTTEYGTLNPDGFDPAIFTELLGRITLTPADPKEVPEGEYVVLTFPEEKTRYDFFLGEPEQNLIRQVNPDGSEELFRASVPEGMAPVSQIMASWADSLADTLGLVPPVEAEMPEKGWVLDSLTGFSWVDDRAELEVFLEDTDNYKVLISWADSAFETEEWTYACEYDAESQTLRASWVIFDTVTVDENGEEIRENVYEKESQAVFSLNAEGRLAILEAGDEALEGKTFEKVPDPQKEAAPWNVPETTEITPEAKAMFEKALEGLLGVNYTPLAVLAERDGTLCFLCRTQIVYPGAAPGYALVYANEAGLQEIRELDLDY